MDLEEQQKKDFLEVVLSGVEMVLVRNRGRAVSFPSSSLLMRLGVRLTSSSSLSSGETLLINAVDACNSIAFLPCPSAGGHE